MGYPKLVPVISLLLAGLSLVLSVILVVSDAEKVSFQKYTTIQLNTSTIFQDAIKIKDSSKSRRSYNQALSTRLPSWSPLNVRDDNPISRASSFFDGIKTSFLPRPTGTLSDSFDDLVDESLGQIASIFGESINIALDQLISGVVRRLGIKQWYGLYFNELCSANYRPSYRDQDATLTNITCKSLRGSGNPSTFYLLRVQLLKFYSTAFPETPHIPDTFQVGSTILDFSSLNLPAKITGTGGGSSNFFRLLYILAVLGIVTTALHFILTFFLFFDRFDKPWIYLVIGLTAGISAFLFLTIAIVENILAIFIARIVNQIAGDLGIIAKSGAPLLALAWSSFVLMLIPTIILLRIWFISVYVRKSKVVSEK